MSPARVVVFGYGPSALAALDTLEALQVTPVAVVVPGNRSGDHVDMVTARARQRGWPLLVQPPRSAIGPFLAALRALAPDVLLVWSYTMLLPAEVIAVPAKGAVNIHGALLPEYRGGHVMNWTIANGDAHSGATLHYLDAGIDTGPVVAIERFSIEPHDDIASVQGKLQAAGAALLRRWWPAIANGTAPRTPQDETRARYYRMRSADDGRIAWAQGSAQIQNLVRALVHPWPGARTLFGDTLLVLRRVEPVASSRPSQPPGTVVGAEPGDIRVATGDGVLRLIAIEIDGAPADHERLRRAGIMPGVVLT